MQVCPLCDAKFPQEATFCWFDGSKLAGPDAQSGTESATEPETFDASAPAAELDTPQEIENDPEVLKAKEQANHARLAAEQAVLAAEQANRVAQEAAQRARKRAQEKAATALALLEEARAKAEARLEEANRAEQERQEVEAEVEAAKAAELQAKHEAQEAQKAKQCEEQASKEAKERAEAAVQAASAAKAAEEQALDAAKAAALTARKAEEMVLAVQQEAQKAKEAEDKAKLADEVAREKVAHECQTTQVLQQAVLEKAIAEREAREAAQQALAAVGADSSGSLQPDEVTQSKPAEEVQAAKEAEVPKEVQVPDETIAQSSLHRIARDWEGQTLRHYNILKHLGTGSQGDVFLAKHTTSGERVALKILNERTCEEPKRVARFFEILEKASALEHPGLINIRETVHELDAPSFYTMDALNGATLSSYRPKSLDVSLEIAAQLGKALAKAHENKIVHGQLNMDNVYLLANSQGKRRVSILDFGAYELRSETSELSVHDDLRSLGTILEKIFAPFEEKPPELKRVIEICLTPGEQEKPKSADDIAKTLQWIMGQRPAQKRVEQAPATLNQETLIDENDDDDDFEVLQWKQKSSARKRKIVASMLGACVAVAAIAYGTQMRWDEALDNLTTRLNPASIEDKASSDNPQAKTTPAAIKAEKKSRVETSSLKPVKQRVMKKSKPAKVSKATKTKIAKLASPAPAQKQAAPSKTVAVAPAVKTIKPPSPPPAPIRVEFQSNPVGARVRSVADKKVVGVTPFTLQLPSNSSPAKYEFSLPGYSSVSQQWDPRTSSRVLATLKVQARKAEAKPPTPAQKKSSVKPAQATDTNTHEDLVDPFAQEEG